MNPASAFLEALRSRSHALVMGVLNVTPDSFSDGGRYPGVDEAVAAAHQMVAAGAAIIDVGGESTRPGAEPIDQATEIERVLPVIERLRDLPVSIDTRHAAVARRALEAGAIVVNDVSAGADPEMFPLVAEHGAAIVLMHMLGEPGTMQDEPSYRDVVFEVEDMLLGQAEGAAKDGVNRDLILIDPGIGFGKTLEHNLALLGAVPRLASHGYPVLMGVSRKRFLGEVTGRATEDRGAATVAAVTLCAKAGAAIVRVHDVPAAVDAVRVAEAWPAFAPNASAGKPGSRRGLS